MKKMANNWAEGERERGRNIRGRSIEPVLMNKFGVVK